MSNSKLAAIVFATHLQTEAAVGALVGIGYDAHQLSVVGKDYHTADQAVGFYNAGDQVKFWGRLGAFWSRLSVRLRGGATMAIPGFGYFVALGPLADAVLTVRERAVGCGFGALGAALIRVGIPMTVITKYERALRTDQFVLILRGSPAEVETCCDALEKAGAADIDIYDKSYAGFLLS